jgi:hypothetical protein
VHAPAIEIGKEQRIGPWTVSTEVAQTVDEYEMDVLLARKAYLDIPDIMNGTILYYLKIPSISCTSSIFLEFATSPLSKSNRPLAWKNTDEKIQTTLPLVICTPTALRSLSEGDDKTGTLVRVQLKLSHYLEKTTK